VAERAPRTRLLPAAIGGMALPCSLATAARWASGGRVAPRRGGLGGVDPSHHFLAEPVILRPLCMWLTSFPLPYAASLPSFGGGVRIWWLVPHLNGGKRAARRHSSSTSGPFLCGCGSSQRPVPPGTKLLGGMGPAPRWRRSVRPLRALDLASRSASATIVDAMASPAAAVWYAKAYWRGDSICYPVPAANSLKAGTAGWI